MSAPFLPYPKASPSTGDYPTASRQNDVNENVYLNNWQDGPIPYPFWLTEGAICQPFVFEGHIYQGFIGWKEEIFFRATGTRLERGLTEEELFCSGAPFTIFPVTGINASMINFITEEVELPDKWGWTYEGGMVLWSISMNDTDFFCHRSEYVCTKETLLYDPAFHIVDYSETPTGAIYTAEWKTVRYKPKFYKWGWQYSDILPLLTSGPIILGSVLPGILCPLLSIAVVGCVLTSQIIATAGASKEEDDDDDE